MSKTMRVLAAGLVFLASCTKIEMQSGMSAAEKVTLLTEAYTSGVNKKITGKDVARAAVADIGMAVGVVQTTGWVGGFFGPIYAVGVTAISTMASYGALKTAPQPGTTVLVNNLGDANLGEVVPSTNNPFEYIGRHHNIGLTQLASYCGPGLNYNCQISDLDSVLFSYYINHFENYAGGYNPEELNQRFDLYTQFADMTTEELIASLVNAGNISQEASSILLDYISAIEASPTSVDFCNYSIQVEDIVQSSNLNSTEKNALLVAFAIGRYSVTYWSNIYS